MTSEWLETAKDSKLRFQRHAAKQRRTIPAPDALRDQIRLKFGPDLVILIADNRESALPRLAPFGSSIVTSAKFLANISLFGGSRDNRDMNHAYKTFSG